MTTTYHKNFGIKSLDILISDDDPIKVGEATDLTMEYSSSTKELFGASRFALAVAQTEAKLSGKAKTVVLQAEVLRRVLGGAITTGTVEVIRDEAGAIPGSSTYVVTVTHSATYVDDLGVKTSADVPLARVYAAPDLATGKYMVSAGVYTFSDADKGTNVKISYSYTNSAVGKTLTVSNSLMSEADAFVLLGTSEFQGQVFTIKIHKAIFSKLSIPLGVKEFTMLDVDFTCSADSADKVLTISMAS